MLSFRKVLFSFIAFTFIANPALAVFNDVSDELTPEVIEWLRDKSIGEQADNFYPKRPISIAEFLSMGLTAAGVEDLPRNAPSRFSDVKTTDWFSPYVVKAEELDLLDDFAGEKLFPNRALNRGEVVKLSMEIFGVGVPLTLPDEEFGFDDVRETHRLARYIFQAVKMGIIDPLSDHSFGVTHRVNRAEAATLFYQLANFMPEGSTQIIIQSGGATVPHWQLFETVWNEAQDKFLFEEDLLHSKMMHQAVQGMIGALNDPYSEFYTPEQTQSQTSNLSGEVEGIGVFIELDPEGRGLLIVSPIFNSPADQVGLRSGDIITAVDGTSLSGMTLEEAASHTRGPATSSAVYTIFREDHEFDVSIVREKVKIDSVSLEFRNNIAIIDINQFTSSLPEDFAEIIEEVIQRRAQGIILDLRNNGGGLVTAAVDLLGYWLPKGAIVASQEFREGLEGRNLNYNTERDPILQGLPTTVLVNKGSASASEIVAAAMQDHNAAAVAGEQTFGKGTVQEISFFQDGTALKLTIAHWLSPRQQPIQDVGVTPHYEAVDNPETIIDEAIEKILDTF